MLIPPSKDPVEFTLAAADVAAKLDSILAKTPALQGAELQEILRFVPNNRLIIAGQAKGKPAVFRWFLHPRAREMAATEWFELLRAWPHMSGARNRTPEPVHHDQQAGLLVLGRVAGTPLMDTMRDADTENQLAAIARAVDWHNAYTAPTLTRGGADTKRWLDRAAKACEGQPFPQLRQIEEGILAELSRLADALHRKPWSKAIGHGDFHLNNLLLQGNILTGIDLGGSAIMPLVKDLARALTHMARRDVMPTGDRLFGVDRAAFDIMSKGLTGRDRKVSLPFFIAYETLIRVEKRRLSPARIQVAEEVAGALLQDLKTVEVN